MRIVSRDNFDREIPGTSDEYFILWPLSPGAAEGIAEILNAETGMYSPRYYVVVEDDYELVTYGA